MQLNELHYYVNGDHHCCHDHHYCCYCLNCGCLPMNVMNLRCCVSCPSVMGCKNCSTYCVGSMNLTRECTTNCLCCVGSMSC